MPDFIIEAGWGIYPVFAFGFTALGAALWHALAPAARRSTLVFGFGAATLLSGVLGTVVGLQRSVQHIGALAATERWVFLIGLREALNCTASALVLTTIAALFVTYGSYRQAQLQDRSPATGAKAGVVANA